MLFHEVHDAVRGSLRRPDAQGERNGCEPIRIDLRRAKLDRRAKTAEGGRPPPRARAQEEDTARPTSPLRVSVHDAEGLARLEGGPPVEDMPGSWSWRIHEAMGGEAERNRVGPSAKQLHYRSPPGSWHFANTR